MHGCHCAATSKNENEVALKAWWVRVELASLGRYAYDDNNVHWRQICDTND